MPPPTAPPWRSALVTGASSGIGTAIARQLADSGVSLVLVARRVDRLDQLAAELGSTKVEVLAADLARDDDCARVAARLADTEQPIDLLVNCAGLGAAGVFADGDLEVYRQMLAVNVEALVALSHAAVGPMRDRGRGWIVNISSLGGHAPGPRFAVYSATKAFVTSFSEALHEELRRSGVVVTAICPGATRTEFGEVSGADSGDLPDFLWQGADEVAAEALAAAAAGRAVRRDGLAEPARGGVHRRAPPFRQPPHRGQGRRPAVGLVLLSCGSSGRRSGRRRAPGCGRRSRTARGGSRRTRPASPASPRDGGCG